MQDISCMLIIIAYKSSYSDVTVPIELHCSNSQLKLQYQPYETPVPVMQN